MSDIPYKAVSLKLLLSLCYSPVETSRDPLLSAKASYMAFDIPLSQPPSLGFKGDSKAGREGGFFIGNNEAFRHLCPDYRLLWGKLGKGQQEAKHPVPLFRVHAYHSLLGPKPAARDKD